MKRLLILLFIFISSQNLIFAGETNLSFIYINGSNNNNTKMKNWYENGVKKLHPILKKDFETNKMTKPWFNQTDGIYNINQEPVIFFWGDKSKEELAWVKRQLEYSKSWKPTFAYFVRSTLTAYLHDAIWVQKTHNMMPVIGNLNTLVQNEYKNGRRSVLFGYSAGTFITYEYLSKKLPYIDMINLSNTLKLDTETKNFIEQHPQKSTCLSALENSGIGVVSDEGRLFIDKSQGFKENYLKLNSVTDKICSPEGALQGVVNFASPLALFYSDFADTNYEMSYYNALMFKYIIEHGIFFLTVNFREDPLGFPITKNATVQELEEFTKLQFTNPNGFIYDNSGVWSRHSFLGAHMAYWKSGKPFADAVVKTYVKGGKFNYNDKYQQQQLKKRDKNLKLW